MNPLEAVESIHMNSDPDLGILATFRMKYPSSTATLVLMEHCQELLSCSFRLFFPDSEFVFSTSAKAAEFTCEINEEWNLRNEGVFDLFIRTLVRRHSRIKYSADKKLYEPAPWH